MGGGCNTWLVLIKGSQTFQCLRTDSKVKPEEERTAWPTLTFTVVIAVLLSIAELLIHVSLNHSQQWSATQHTCTHPVATPTALCKSLKRYKNNDHLELRLFHFFHEMQSMEVTIKQAHTNQRLAVHCYHIKPIPRDYKPTVEVLSLCSFGTVSQQ